jgi:hypothetical protein
MVWEDVGEEYWFVDDRGAEESNNELTDNDNEHWSGSPLPLCWTQAYSMYLNPSRISVQITASLED